ncbi:SGNH/GDSL hydrolase family protein [Frigoribacterium sp. CG_9.8]|uniref:SGNH/GDSL hydrolase family protein n=1 Tax=Frigoribacterium sp. CG_9.8 TaxID=2787733 RepID=UPI0018C970A2|nr:acyl-CoA thioesterase-1 [Frigoribacterium sp. CG_9.8]
MIRKFLRVAAIPAVAVVAVVTSLAGAAPASTSLVITAVKINSSATGPLVVAVGDSILSGHGLGSDESWVAQLALQNNFNLVNLASDGSGFVTAGDNNDTFADQITTAIDLKADVVILSGSSNDLGQSDAAVETAIGAVVTKLHTALQKAQIIAVSGVWGATALPPQMVTINDSVRTAVKAVGGTYLHIGQPLGGRVFLMQTDEVHPTAAGQAAIAHHVTKALNRAGEAL